MNNKFDYLNDAYLCSVCGSGNQKKVCQKGAATYAKCACCQVTRQYPYPTDSEIASYYKNYKSIKSASSCYLESSYEILKRDKEFTFSDLGVNLSEFRNRSHLDVGCATGDYILFMNEIGCQKTFGIDISEECISLAKQRKLNCALANIDDVNETFDMVSLWHVIEHVRNPRKLVENIYKRINQNGWFFIETPVTGPVSDGFGAHWRYFMPVEHINLFSMNALVRLCLDAGFSLKSWTSFGSGNEAEAISQEGKRAMDQIAKAYGFGDTFAAWFEKR